MQKGTIVPKLTVTKTQVVKTRLRVSRDTQSSVADDISTLNVTSVKMSAESILVVLAHFLLIYGLTIFSVTLDILVTSFNFFSSSIFCWLKYKKNYMLEEVESCVESSVWPRTYQPASPPTTSQLPHHFNLNIQQRYGKIPNSNSSFLLIKWKSMLFQIVTVCAALICHIVLRST